MKSGDGEDEASGSNGGAKEVKKPSVSTDDKDGPSDNREVKKSEPSGPSVNRASAGGNEGTAAKKADSSTS